MKIHFLWALLLLPFLVLSGCSSKTTTEKVSPKPSMHQGHEYVDLGLSVKWATMNIGADSPYDFGDYFAWGETKAKEECIWLNYQHSNGKDESLNKYCLHEDEGIVDNKTQLEPMDDVASVKWGGQWRVPTNAEIEELLNECYWEWTQEYKGHGVWGWMVFKAKNDADKGLKRKKDGAPITQSSYSAQEDAHIFLPLPGHHVHRALREAGWRGTYWSSTLCDFSSFRAYILFVDELNTLSGASLFRCVGQNVRAVCP
jgi:hypothetical protein